MFGTFRYSKTTKDYEHIELSNDDTVDARGHTLVACDLCRTRKLKCNGDRNSCDRCLAGPSRTCTYIGRKRPPPSTPQSSSSVSKRAYPRNLTEQGRVEVETSGNASSVSISPSAISVASSVPSPSTSMTTIERLPTPNSLDLPCEIFDKLTDSDELKQSQMIQSPSVDFDWILQDHMQPPITPSAWTTPDLAAQKSQEIPDWDSEMRLEFGDQQPEQAKQVESQPPPAPALFPAQLAGKEVYCKCLITMTQLLEDIGVSLDNTGIDTLLMCLGRGTKMCSDILACIHCNTCVDNAMLFATISQLLVSTAKKVSSRLLLGHREGNDHDANTWKSCAVAEMGDSRITFGKYRIELPDMKVRLIYKMALLHLEDLQKLLANVKERIGPKRGAWGLLADAESKAAKVCWMIQELSK